jgi:hypothetical protein
MAALLAALQETFDAHGLLVYLFLDFDGLVGEPDWRMSRGGIDGVILSGPFVVLGCGIVPGLEVKCA